MIGLLAAPARLYLRLPRSLRFLGPVAVMAWLWHESSQQPTQVISGLARTIFYNSMHVVAYAMLGTAWLLALLPMSRRDLAAARRAAMSSVILSGCYGVVDEVHQSYVPGRTPSCGDVMSDLCGAILATLLWLAVLEQDRLAMRALPWWLLPCCGSVAIATFVSW